MKMAKPSDIAIDLSVSALLFCVIYFVITLFTGCRVHKEVVTTRTDSTVTETTKPDSVRAPSDSVSLFLRWSQICDSTWRSKMMNNDSAIQASKEAIWDSLNHSVKRIITGTVKLTPEGLKFVCREDSLQAVIDSLVLVKTKVVKQEVKSTPVKKQKWTPMLIIGLLLSLGILCFGVAKVIRG